MQDPLTQLLGDVATPSLPAQAAASSQMVVMDQDGVRLVFEVSPVAGMPGSTTIQATATNSGLDDLADFNLQVGICCMTPQDCEGTMHAGH